MKSALIVLLLILGVGLVGLFLVVHQDTMHLSEELERAEKILARLPQNAEVPVFIGKRQDRQVVASLSASSILVSDRVTNAQLFERKSTEERYPASTAKLMTALVARDIYKLDDVLTVREEAFSEGAIMGLLVGEKMSVRNLLAGLLIFSGNDAAFVLANNSQGGYQSFVDKMNHKAEQLGLEHTYFTNASGLDSEQQQTSAHDLYIITEEVLKDSLLAELVKTKELTVKDTSGTLTHPLVNRNTLLHTFPGVFGVKTGTTDSAGENLITAVRRNKRELVIIVLGSQARYFETEELISWIDQNYRWETQSVLDE
jgi:serine-type D-Ala-D-Ala carboxypeptidase (penicillin-binding protein 5/6)